jgi:hypothetical protein
MNMFRNNPDSLAGLAGCAFWLFALAGLFSLFFNVITRVLR